MEQERARHQIALDVDATLAIGATLLIVFVGCTPAHYRSKADLESYQVIDERLYDPRWVIPSVSIEPDAHSRHFDPFDPDQPPHPPDDPSAHEYMHVANRMKGYAGWHDFGDAPWVESPHWRDCLILSDRGDLALTPDRAFELGLLHSREYQTELEDLYLTALVLTLDRFEFALQWFGGNDTAYQHSGASGVPTESNTLTTRSTLGVGRALSRGGQLLVNFANTYVWEFTGSNVTQMSSNIAIDLIQPLLRRAAREVRLERLTQSERNVLYEVRNFARFRKQFYVEVTTGSEGYLSLLLQLQNIRNLEANLDSLQQNLDLHNALAEMGAASRIQVDQVFQSYQRGRLALLQAHADFETALDAFKLILGLPPTLPVELDDSRLDPFQLSDPAITVVQQEVAQLLTQFRELDEAPSLDHLRDGFKKLQDYHDPVAMLIQQIRVELDRWESRTIEREDGQQDDQFRRELVAFERLSRRLAEMPGELKTVNQQLAQDAEALAEDKRTEGWEALQNRARQYLEYLGELFVRQTEVRVHLIELRPIDHESPAALRFALENRLDLMNEQARVVDAWRKIKVAADGLQSDLDVVFDADIETEPGSNKPFDFSAAASSYRLGLRFDAPLNRKAEANNYRASLVNYQRARRFFIALQDTIQQDVRRDLRQLKTDALNFEIARESLLVAARQVEQTRDQLLLAAPGDSSSTQDVLNALNELLGAKDALIGIWVNYEANRMQLLLDLEALQLDERGVYSGVSNVSRLAEEISSPRTDATN